MIAAASFTPPILLLIGVVFFFCGCGVATIYVRARPKAPVGRRYVQERKDITR